jgi:tripartite-type tricarboxylate transporter receptor subunit TctC
VKLRLVNSGAGSIWHIAATYLEQVSVQNSTTSVRWRCAGCYRSDGCHINAVTVNDGEVLSGVEAGKLKILAIMTEERDPNMPDVPKMKESGFDVVIGGWGGLGVPMELLRMLWKSLVPLLKKQQILRNLKISSASVEWLSVIEHAPISQNSLQNQTVFFTDLLSKMELGG